MILKKLAKKLIKTSKKTVPAFSKIFPEKFRDNSKLTSWCVFQKSLMMLKEEKQQNA